MYHAYILRSLKTGRLYKGSCEDLNRRVAKHNAGHVRSTKPYRPWSLVHHEEFATRSQAFRREQYWKTAKGARELQSILNQ
ncbi:MAG: GIY-YIG nuclease family protein [Lentisphaerae bacterium]|nr:GIY-YIG nuclease family protein [Lentisphaerota bacterium]